MKKNRKHISLAIVVLFFVLSLFSSCDKYSDVGLEILPTDDLISIRGNVFKDGISSYTFSESSIKTDETNKSLLGSFNDPAFGKTNINFAAQIRMYRSIDFGSNPIIDSIKMFLSYSNIYGDTITPQKFKVYEMESGLDIDVDYNMDVDLKSMASTQLLGEVDYLPKVTLDSATSDTLYQVINIPIDNSLGEKLMNATPAQMADNDLFLDYFKGLLIESEPINDEGGSILTLEAAYSGTVIGSGLLVYYTNDTIKENFGSDTSFIAPYVISPFSARVNSIEHDYSGTSFFQNLDSEEKEDSIIYVQASGLKSKILIEDLSSWKDSTNTAINKAELIFQVDTTLSQVDLYPPPSRLYFTYIDDSTNTEKLPDDYYFSTSFYGGVLDTDDYTYHFNITKHLQNIIDGKGNLGFYLTTGNIADKANRVILKGGKSTTGIKLIVTYSKFNT